MRYTLYPIKLFIRKKQIFIPLFFGILINATGWIWMAAGVTKRSEEAVLHYTALFQIDRLGAFSALYYVPAFGLGILIVNLFFSWLLYGYDMFLSELVLFGAALMQIGVLSAISILVLLNS